MAANWLKFNYFGYNWKHFTQTRMVQISFKTADDYKHATKTATAAK